MRRRMGLIAQVEEGAAQRCAASEIPEYPMEFAQVRRISWVRGVGRSDVVSGLLVQPRSGRPLS